LVGDIFKRITDLLANEDASELNRLMADSVRVLAVYRGVCWRSEMVIDLLKLYRFLNRMEIINPKLLDRALDELRNIGVVTIEERRRGLITYSGTYMDKLIGLSDLNATLAVLAKDTIYKEYMSERYRKIRDALKKAT